MNNVIEMKKGNKTGNADKTRNEMKTNNVIETKKENKTDNAVKTKNVIELKNVTKDYGDFKLDNISFSVPEGCICGFIGQNGAGKTTTIKLLLDVIGADEGEIFLFGHNIKKDSAKLREDIGIVFDEMGFHEFMTGNDINIMMKNIYRNWDEQVFFDYLKRFSLPAKKKCGEFSRGMRMKLQIAVALSHHARLLVMDEPTSGLDPIVRNEMLRIFREYVTGKDHTILLSSHITGDLEKLAEEVVFINRGRIVLSGNKDAILEKHGLVKCEENEMTSIDGKWIVSVQPGTKGKEVLVNDREEFKKKHPEMPVESVSLEEIMIFYVNQSEDAI
ncbi:MAG: ABC transporter ATP-binding protein [Lachnospiraceae bacterium]